MTTNEKQSKNALYIIENFTHSKIEKEYTFKIRKKNIFDFGNLFTINNYCKPFNKITIEILKYQYCQVFLNILTWKITPSINFEKDGKMRNLILNHDKVLTNGFTMFWKNDFSFKIGEKLTIKARFLNIFYEKENHTLNPTFLTRVFNRSGNIICKIISNLTMLEGSY
ncbi:MAG: hypothetical protein GF317_09070 [Candidatus Lokiarchaeota archaeon]|nr:hypothetical protein [Candidatus Lokiarchaeota archaeon]MBD3199863.1 hypothetical protein [Candidatus Lokiarchaeota archaeon]